MSSWANIYVPKKRNLGAIPSQYQAEIKPSTTILHFVPNVIPSAFKNDDSNENITTPHESYVKAFRHPAFTNNDNSSKTTNIMTLTENISNLVIEPNPNENSQKNDEKLIQEESTNNNNTEINKNDEQPLTKKVRIIKKIRKIKIQNDYYENENNNLDTTNISENFISKEEHNIEIESDNNEEINNEEEVETEEEEIETSDEERNGPYNPKYYFPNLNGFKIISRPAGSAFELIFKGYSYVFVILRNLSKINDNVLWIRCYNSIRQFYTNKIIIIDDNSSINTYDSGLYNTEIIRSKFKGAGEILPYYYFLKYQWADRMIFLQDSMFFTRIFYPSEIEGEFKFYWYTKNQESDSNNELQSIMNIINNNHYLSNYMNDNSKWYGCFGGTSICSLEIIKFINNEYNIFISLISEIKNKSQRRAFQKLLGLIAFNEGIINFDNCSIYGNIIDYPAAFNKNIQFDKMEHIVNAHGYDTAIIKLWRGR
jgi:hypothetical protein